ncbi:Hydrogen peroxide-inducible genes activator [Sinobacterium norvegicum]|uniref:Hydrogen peroxide-inducible genes activator n=1 Tax=Sinobacterium norvegicum TaxID=1641715 RepID=A0ABM9AI47_9GAMM|nr:hydrogen peroxide-inducible genes activator [Sinobacterium norvegicum]CAH0992817.1 Hydrogen peroxide-inducible genes activator [Sinobacterium norvegicum]
MPTPAPTIRQLEYFIALAEAKTFRGAASALSISQPTLSAQIYSLEQLLKLPLFERSRSGAMLTPAGRDLLDTARQTLEQMRAFTDRASLLSGGVGGLLRLGVSPTLGPYLLPHILSDLHRQYGELKLYVREKKPKTLELDLVEGRLDLVLIPLPFQHPQITTEVLFDEPLKLVCSRDHSFADQGRLQASDLHGQNVLTLEAGYSHYQQVRQCYEALGANILRDYEGTSLDALRQMVVMGMGMAFLPSLYIYSEIHRPESIAVLDIDGVSLSRSHVLAWRKNSPNRGFYLRVAKLIRQLVRHNLTEAGLAFPGHGS